MELIMISRMRRQASPHRKIRGFPYTYMLSTDQNPITKNRIKWSVFYESTKEDMVDFEMYENLNCKEKLT